MRKNILAIATMMGLMAASQEMKETKKNIDRVAPMDYDPAILNMPGLSMKHRVLH